jgi:hypothetical protein
MGLLRNAVKQKEHNERAQPCVANLQHVLHLHTIVMIAGEHVLMIYFPSCFPVCVQISRN